MGKNITIELLPIGTLKCSCHNKVLEFKQIHGMRLVEGDGKEKFISARCSKTHKYFNVKTK